MCLSPGDERRARISIALRLRSSRLDELARQELERLRPPPRVQRVSRARSAACDRDVERALDLGREGPSAPVSPSDGLGGPGAGELVSEEEAWSLFDLASFELRRGAYSGDPWDVFEPGGADRFRLARRAATSRAAR